MTNCIDTITYSPIPSGPRLDGAAMMGRAEWIGRKVGRAIDLALLKLADGLVSLFDTLLTWQQRANERAHLAALDDAMLKDIGLSRADVMRETGKGFWLS